MGARQKTLSSLEKKIVLLQERREDLRIKESLFILKECEKVFESECTADLILTILTETWEKASPEQKKEWQNKAHTFHTRKPKRKTDYKSTRKNQIP